MSTKSFEDLVSILSKKGYKITFLEVVHTGIYKAIDVDWNYKDAPHVEQIHSDIDGIHAFVEKKICASIFFQTLPFLRFKVPLSVVCYESSKSNLVYYTSFGPYLLVVNSTYEDTNSGARTLTKFAIVSTPLFSILSPIIRKFLKNNNGTVMSEDVPMRIRRQELRTIGHYFYRQGESYEISAAEDIRKANVRLDNNRNHVISLEKSLLFKLSNSDIVGESDGVLSFMVRTNADSTMLFPRTCPHEGAKVEQSCFTGNRLICPWHGRRLLPIIEITGDHIEILRSEDYTVNIDNEYLSIKYDNV